MIKPTFPLIKMIYDRHMLLIIAAFKDEGSCLFQLPKKVLLAISKLQYYLEKDSRTKD